MVHTYNLHCQVQGQQPSRNWQEELGVPVPLCAASGTAPDTYQELEEESHQEHTLASSGNWGWEQSGNKPPAYLPGPPWQEAGPPWKNSSWWHPALGAQYSQFWGQPYHCLGRHCGGTAHCLPGCGCSCRVQEQEQQGQGCSTGLWKRWAHGAPTEPLQRQLRGVIAFSSCASEKTTRTLTVWDQQQRIGDFYDKGAQRPWLH